MALALAACGGSVSHDVPESGGGSGGTGAGAPTDGGVGGTGGSTFGGTGGTFGGTGGTGAGGAGAGGAGATGGASTGGSGAVGGAAGSGGESFCPPSPPGIPTSCSDVPDGTYCSYPESGGCCPLSVQCENGMWVGFPCDPPPPQPCPAEPPTPGSPCIDNPCGSPLVCTYTACADGSGIATAQCNGGTWQVSPVDCPSQPPCKGLSACDCLARKDCQVEATACFCPCELQCGGGMGNCDCFCGGGQYLGCKTAAGG